MQRRRFVETLCTAALGAAFGPCRADAVESCAQPLPDRLARDERVQAAWAGLDPARVWDAHAHLIGIGAGGSGAYAHPDTASWFAPVERLRRWIILSAACVGQVPAAELDAAYVTRMLSFLDAMPPGVKTLLFAFDYTVDEDGREQPERSTFHVPNAYARAVAARHPGRFEWVASIHPYRHDAVERLDAAAKDGARAVKWLPSSMGIDPAAARCDRFYARLAALRLPLVVHVGEEKAVPGAGRHLYNNVLRLRRPLEQGVRVVAAHAASLGEAHDIDRARRGDSGPRVRSFDLFARLMDEPRYEGRLCADISAVFQRNRDLDVQQTLLRRVDWHPRLLQGTDYPLPGVRLLYKLDTFVQARMLRAQDAAVLAQLQKHNPLLFEFVLKRSLSLDGSASSRFAPRVFHTRDFFDPTV